jgi:hypothetical protein
MIDFLNSGYLTNDICWIGPLIISSKNQLVSIDRSQLILWDLKSHLTRHALRAVQVSRAAVLLNLNMTFPQLEPMTLALIPFV